MPGRTSITFVPFIFHRDREIWGDDCEEFRPERWISGEAREPKRTNAYVPFSAGPRFVSMHPTLSEPGPMTNKSPR